MSKMPPAIQLKNGKKEERAKAKKRKLEAFLNLVRKDGGEPLAKKKNQGTFSENFKALKDELKKYQTKKDVEPTFYLKDTGFNALVNVSSEKKMKCNVPLFFADIYYLLLKSLIGQLSPFSLNWCSIERPQYITKTVVINVEKLSKSDICDLHLELKGNSKIFQYVFKVLSAKSSFASDLSTFHLPSSFYDPCEENQPSTPENTSSINSPNETRKIFTFSKLHLLLSPIQLAMENYPLPPSVFKVSKCDCYVFSKESYAPVTTDSPMFAMDCEMCKTALGNEVTRVAIVDEDLKTVYHTFVKPQEKIIDYMTKYSGITKEMLKNVTTTLSDVHEDIRRILPKDAILCGQSLNCDLHALKMIHPYVIDTSVIFNTHGIRQKKTSLKMLSKLFLNEVIQNSKKGHHPIEDSIATMKLVQLKLQKSIDFGDAVLSENIINESSNLQTQGDKNNQSESVEEPSKLLNTTPNNLESDQCGFFERITKFSKKKICLIGNEDVLGSYYLKNSYDKVYKKIKSSSKKVIKSVVKNLNEFDLIIGHLNMKEENFPIDLVGRLKQTYDSLPNRTLFLLITNGNKSKSTTFNHSYCMAVLKTEK